MINDCEALANRAELAHNAGRRCEWPDLISEPSARALALYYENQEYRAYADWLEADLFELARMSKMQDNAIDLQEMLEDEGHIMIAPSGLRKEHPAVQILANLHSQILGIARRMGVNVSTHKSRIGQSCRRATAERG